MTKEILTYEVAMRELQGIVNALQEEMLGVDDLADKVQRAAVLIQFCKEKLRSTEANVKDLL